MFPTYDHDEWRDAESKIRTGRALCLPGLLRERGYRSVYLSHANRRENYIESQFLSLGFRETWFRHNLPERFLDGEAFATPGQPSDRQMFRALVEYLERWEGSEPLFLCMSTIQTHTGWDVGEDGVKFGDGSNRVLNTFHNLDRAFGLFWTWFKSSRYFADTIVILTADHALFPNDTARRVMPPGSVDANLAPIALLIHDPTHELPREFEARSSSLDLAPSLLHLLEFENRPNSFAGLSLFGDRQGYLGGPGMSEEGSQVLHWVGGEARIEAVRDAECADEDHADREPCRILYVVRYLQGLERANRIWRD